MSSNVRVANHLSASMMSGTDLIDHIIFGCKNYLPLPATTDNDNNVSDELFNPSTSDTESHTTSPVISNDDEANEHNTNVDTVVNELLSDDKIVLERLAERAKAKLSVCMTS